MGKFWAKVAGLTGRLNAYMALAGGVAILFMFAIITYDVFMRYFLVRPTRWALDIGEMLMLPVVFLPAALLMREGGHIRMSMLVTRIHGLPRAVIELTTYLIGMLWALLMARQGWLTFIEFLQRGKLSQIAELPMSPAVFFIPLGAAFLVVEFIVRIVDGVIDIIDKRESDCR